MYIYIYIYVLLYIYIYIYIYNNYYYKSIINIIIRKVRLIDLNIIKYFKHVYTNIYKHIFKHVYNNYTDHQ